MRSAFGLLVSRGYILKGNIVLLGGHDLSTITSKVVHSSTQIGVDTGEGGGGRGETCAGIAIRVLWHTHSPPIVTHIHVVPFPGLS